MPGTASIRICPPGPKLQQALVTVQPAEQLQKISLCDQIRIDFQEAGCYIIGNSYKVLLAAGEAWSVNFVSIGL